MLKKYWELLRPFHKSFYQFIALIVVYETVQIGDSYVISLLVQMFSTNAQMIHLISIILIAFIIDEFFMRLDNAYDWHVLAKIMYPLFKFLKLRAVAKFLVMDLTWHQNHNSGALVGKVAKGVDKVLQIIEELSWQLVPTMIQIVLSLIPLIIISFPAAGITTCAFIIFIWLTLKSNNERQPFRFKRYDNYERESHESTALVQAIPTITLFGQQERMMAEQIALHDDIIDLGLSEGRVSIYKYNRLRIRVLVFARRLIQVFWVWQLYQGTLTIANLIFINTLTEKLFSSFWNFSHLLSRISEGGEGAKRLMDLLSEEENPKQGMKVLDVSGPVDIHMQDVDFAYDGLYEDGKGALHNLNLTIPGGKVIGIVGRSGAGKTTIQKVIAGLVDIQSGKVMIGNIDITDWDDLALKRLFSHVPQGDDVYIFHGSLMMNIAFPRPEASKEEVENAAKLAGIHDFILTLEDGYETIVGERGKRLSGGQKQRIALARAILADRPILILDEATSAVDAITEKEIQLQMKTILKGKTAIIIAHRLSTIRTIADLIIVLEKGRIVEQGTHEELITINGLYAEMVAVQNS